MLVEAPSLHAPVTPVRIIRSYRDAPRFHAGARRSIRLATHEHAAVRAPCAGRVAFVGRVGSASTSVSLWCSGGRRVTVGGLQAHVRPGVAARVGDRLGVAQADWVSLSLRVAGVYRDPGPLRERPGAAPPPVVVARPPSMRALRPVRVHTLVVEASAPARRAAPRVDRWLGVAGIGIGGVAALVAMGAGLRRRTVQRRRVAGHRVAARR